MELQLPSLAEYNYNHGGRVLLTKKRKMAFLLSLFFALALSRLLFPFGLLALILPALVYLRGERTLKVGPRYLISGERIVYYANVMRIVFSEVEGRLTLRSGVKTEFVIERNRFKDRADKEENFRKVVAEVSERVRLAAPEAFNTEDDESPDAED